MLKLVGAVAVSLSAAITIAQADNNRMVGNWLINTDRDRFSGDDKIVAMTMDQGAMLAVRCMQKTFTLALRDPNTAGELKEGDLFEIKFKADENPVIDTIGDAINSEVIEIAATPEMQKELLSAKEYAFRVSTSAGTQFDRVIRAGVASRALVDVVKACPLPAATN
jgi:hypothetical protein